MDCKHEKRTRWACGEFFTECDNNICPYYGQECPGKDECKEYMPSEKDSE